MPILTVIAGPNGSGKSPLARFVDFDGRERLLDPDAIAVRLNPLNPSAAAVASAKQALNRTGVYFSQSESFAVETTLSSRGRVNLLRSARSQGYKVHLIFITMDSPERCIARIHHRAARGAVILFPMPMSGAATSGASLMPQAHFACQTPRASMTIPEMGRDSFW